MDEERTDLIINVRQRLEEIEELLIQYQAAIDKVAALGEAEETEAQKELAEFNRLRID